MYNKEEIRFIPSFIIDKYLSDEYSGTLNGSILISDISGFTHLTESLFRLKKEGAEELSDILKNIFTKMIYTVYENNGFIANFAGDAFTAVFPSDNGYRARISAESIRKRIPDKVSADGNEYSLGVKSGIDRGEITWQILGNNPYSYLFSGQTVMNAAKAQSDAVTGEIAVNCQIDSAQSADTKTHYTDQDSRKAIERLFYNEDYMENIEYPEFRDVSSVFISFRDIEDMNLFVNDIIESSDKFGGYFNLIDSGDKGNVVFTIFGAPVSNEDDILRSINYASHIRGRYRKNVRIGITYGSVFAGFIGSNIRGHYTVIGDKVNIAARFMSRADWGDIWISENMGRSVLNDFLIEYGGSLELKGKQDAIPYYMLKERRKTGGALFFENQFVGRDEEIDSIKSFIDEINRKHSTGLVNISGEAGIGKTRFIYMLQSILTDYKLIYLKCDEILAKSLNPIESFFEYIFEISGADNDVNSKEIFDEHFSGLINSVEKDENSKYLTHQLSRLKYVIEGFMGINENAAYRLLDGKARFSNILQSFIYLMKIIAGNKKLFIVIDDFQWIDADTNSVISDMLNQISNEHPVLCLLQRPDSGIDISSLKPDNTEQLNIHLKRFSQNDNTAYIKSLLPYKPDKHLSDMITEMSEGNPFYIEQIVLYLLEHDLIDYANEQSVLKAKDIDIPSGISGIIISRIDKLSNDVKQAIKYASVLGREFNIKILSDMLKSSTIDSYLKAGNTERIWDPLTEIQYIFKHALIREAVYKMQMNKRLKQLHLTAGNIIEEYYRHDARMYSNLSYHFEKGESGDKMLFYTKKAAEYAADNYMNMEAIDMYTKYIEHEKDPESIHWAVLKRGETFEIIGEWKKAIENYEQALEYSSKHNNREMLAESYNRKGFILHRMGNNEEALRCFEKAEEIYRTENMTRGLATVHNNLGSAFMGLNDMEKSEYHFKKCLEILKDGDGDRKKIMIRMFAHNNLGLYYQRKHDLDNASLHYKESLDIAHKLKFRRNLASLNFGNIMYLKGDIEKAESYYNKAKGNAEQIGDRHLLRVIMNNLGAISTARCEYEQAMAIYREALSLAENMNDRQGIRILSQNMGEINSYLGDYDSAEQYMRRAVDTAETMSDKKAMGTANGKLGIILFEQGLFSKSIDYLKRGIELSLESENYSAAFELLFRLSLIYAQDRRIEETGNVLNKMKNIPQQFIEGDSMYCIPLIESYILYMNGKTDSAYSAAQSVIDNFKDTEGAAIANMLQYEINGLSENRAEALDIYKRIYESRPIAYYKNIIDSMIQDMG
ncbi:MAG: tetratricopeptide repeat protein [bacterium]